MSVNSIVDVWSGYEIFCLCSPSCSRIYHIRTTPFLISPDASCMFLTPKDKIRIYAEAIDAVGARGQRF